MSKELVISATSHERRVAILEEGQLVEIYIEREKEFALVGSIYKGKVTRVLPGMQSAFVDIGLDGDAFLYVSDVFENLEDYDHGHGHENDPTNGHAPAPQLSGEAAPPIDVLPGETLARASEPQQVESIAEPGGETFAPHDVRTHVEEAEAGAPGVEEAAEIPEDERQPDSNESAPQNFAPQFNPTQYRPSPNYTPRGDRGNDRGSDRGERGNDRSGRGDRPHFGRGRGRFGRGRGRSGRGGRDFRQGGRDLPPSKYASPQGGERSSDRGNERGDRGNDRGDRGYSNRGYDNRGPRRDFDSRRSQGSPRPSGPGESGQEPFLLPGESLAKYRGKPSVEAAAPAVEQESFEPRPELDEPQPRVSGQPAPGGAPRRSRGGLPSWLLAGAPSEAVEGSDEAIEADAEDIRSAASADIDPEDEVSPASEAPISEEEATVLSASLIDAKQDLVREEVHADPAGGGAIFEDEEDEEEEVELEEEAEHAEAVAESSELDDEEEVPEPAVQEIVSAPQAVAEAEADAAHENALHIAALGEHIEIEASHHEQEGAESELEIEEEESAVIDDEHEEQIAASPEPVEETAFLLPGETRSPHTGLESQGEFPRQSARVGGNPRSRFQRPFRGRDRGRDRGGRPDRRGGDRGRGRFDRRGPGGGQRQHHGHGHHGHSHHGPRRPQLISEMLKPGQEIVVQIAKEPLGKMGARITSHIALPGVHADHRPHRRVP